MTTIRVKRHLESDTVRLPEVRPLIGKDVEIIVIEQEKSKAVAADEKVRHPLRGSIVRDDAPYEPAAEGGWEAVQ